MIQDMMKKATVLCLTILVLLLTGCATSLKSLEGVHTIQLTVAIEKSCGGIGGYYSTAGDGVHFICLASEGGALWEDVWSHEADHLFRNLFGLPQPSGHKIKIDPITGKVSRIK